MVTRGTDKDKWPEPVAASGLQWLCTVSPQDGSSGTGWYYGGLQGWRKLFFPLLFPLQQLLAALCRLQKPRSMPKCGFAISKAIKPNSDSIGSTPQLKICYRLRGGWWSGDGAQGQITSRYPSPHTLRHRMLVPRQRRDPNQAPDPHMLHLHPQWNQRASESRFCL